MSKIKMFKMLVVLVCMTFGFTGTAFSQKLEKTLETERDGFSWYRLKQGSKRGAQTTSGSTIIPLGDYFIDYKADSEFQEGGYFVVYCPSRDFVEDGGTMYNGVFTKSGKNIIPLSREYTWICFHAINEHGGGYFGVKKNGKEGICDIDGNEIIAPRYDNIFFVKRLSEFKYEEPKGNFQTLVGYTLDANGRGVRTSTPAPNVASTTTSTSGSKSSTSSSSSSGKGKLLYKGTYSSNGLVYTGNQSMYVMAGTYEIEIYENTMTLNGIGCELKEVMSNGTRKYEMSMGSMGTNYFLVSADYSIRKVYPSQFWGVPDGIEYFQKGQSATPAMQQQYPQQQQPSQQQTNPGYTPRPAEPKNCGVCYGTGKCQTCGGRGAVTNLGIGSGTHPCPNCPNHSGRCQWCNGTGKSN